MLTTNPTLSAELVSLVRFYLEKGGDINELFNKLGIEERASVNADSPMGRLKGLASVMIDILRDRIECLEEERDGLAIMLDDAWRALGEIQ